MTTNTKGYLYALLTVTIWAGWAIITRLGTTSGLTVMDIAFLRYTVAGLITLPIAIKHFHLISRKNILQIIIMIIGAGPLYMLATGMGFSYAPASHSAMLPCVMSVIVAVMSYFIYKQSIGKMRYVGYSIIVAGVIFKLYLSYQSGVATQIYADLYFLCGSILWATYSLQNKAAGFTPLVATAFVATGSMIAMVIPYSIYQYYNPHELDISNSLLQIIYQGVITSVVSLITYNKGIELIGTTKTSAFGALVPVMVVLMAMPILGEIPGLTDIIFVSMMSAGVLLASGIVAFRKHLS